MGYIDWPFMTTHSWGENPRGRWILEIHNDAYSKWASDAKFFKWSLELYGLKFDPNSEEYKTKVPRDTPTIPPSIRNLPGFTSNDNNNNPPIATHSHSATTTTTATTTLEDTTTPETEITTSTEYIPRGCVSKRSECTQNVNDCRTFTHRSVAQVFCRCSSICIEVASNPDNDFNMQCHASASSSLTKKEPRSLKPTSDTPFYCQFIPMLSYN